MFDFLSRWKWDNTQKEIPPIIIYHLDLISGPLKVSCVIKQKNTRGELCIIERINLGWTKRTTLSLMQLRCDKPAQVVTYLNEIRVFRSALCVSSRFYRYQWVMKLHFPCETFCLYPIKIRQLRDNQHRLCISYRLYWENAWTLY